MRYSIGDYLRAGDWNFPMSVKCDREQIFLFIVANWFWTQLSNFSASMHVLRLDVERVFVNRRSLARTHLIWLRFLTQFLYQEHLLVWKSISSFKLVDWNIFTLRDFGMIFLNVKSLTVKIDQFCNYLGVVLNASTITGCVFCALCWIWSVDNTVTRQNFSMVNIGMCLFFVERGISIACRFSF